MLQLSSAHLVEDALENRLQHRVRLVVLTQVLEEPPEALLSTTVVATAVGIIVIYAICTNYRAATINVVASLIIVVFTAPVVHTA